MHPTLRVVPYRECTINSTHCLITVAIPYVTPHVTIRLEF